MLVQRLTLPTEKANLQPELQSPDPTTAANPIYINPYLLSLWMIEWFRHAVPINLDPNRIILDANFDNAQDVLGEFYGTSGELAKRLQILCGIVPDQFTLGTTTTPVHQLYATDHWR